MGSCTLNTVSSVIELEDEVGISYRYYLRCMTHASLMAVSIYLAAHPEWAMYSPVLQYLGQSIDAPR